jgi:hypothetical protein
VAYSPKVLPTFDGERLDKHLAVVHRHKGLHAEDKQPFSEAFFFLDFGLEMRHRLDELLPIAFDRVLHKRRTESLLKVFF